MKGYILTYKSSSRRNITKINYLLFGRISTIQGSKGKEKYYYPGFFEGTSYKKLANGCYFVEQINDDLNGLLEVIPAEIVFKDNVMLNARDFWRNRIKDKVNNW